MAVVIVRCRALSQDGVRRVHTQQTVTLEMMQEAHANLFRGENEAGESDEVEASERPGDATPQLSEQAEFCHHLAEIGRGVVATR